MTASVVEHAQQIGATPGQVALAWVVRQPAITSTLTAARSADELREQLAVFELGVDESFWTSLDRATASPPSYPTDFYERLSRRA